MGLTWDCIDSGRGTLHIRQQLVQRKGEIRLETDLKTHSSRREIHMPESLRTVLLKHREHQESEKRQAGADWAETHAVFATELGRWVAPDNFNRAVDNLVAWSKPRPRGCGRGGIGAARTAQIRTVVGTNPPLPSLTPHDLRHTYATLALRSGVPVEVVSKKLGHTRVSITLDIYRHVTQSGQLEYAIDVFATSMPQADRHRLPVPVLN